MNQGPAVRCRLALRPASTPLPQPQEPLEYTAGPAHLASDVLLVKEAFSKGRFLIIV